jgi:hypothetical protein
LFATHEIRVGTVVTTEAPFLFIPERGPGETLHTALVRRAQALLFSLAPNLPHHLTSRGLF